MISGKSIMSWNVPAVEGGDPIKFAQLLVDYNFEGVCLKAANGAAIQYVSKWSPWPLWGENIRVELINALKEAGLKIYFWHFLFGQNPVGEANAAIAQALKFEPDGYIWDVEGAFDSKPNAESNARLITKKVKLALPDLSQGLCWWALPKNPTTGIEWHPVKVAKAFMEVCDVGMPMMYWQGKTLGGMLKYLHTSLSHWMAFTEKPLIPIGRTYKGDGGEPTPETIIAFANECFLLKDQDNYLPGCSWYSLDKAVDNPLWMAALKSLPRYLSEEPVETPVSLSVEEILDRLVRAHSDLFPELDS